MDHILIDVGPVVFELRQKPCLDGCGHWDVIDSQAPASYKGQHEALVGLTFTVGDNPDWRPVGLARRLQQALNTREG